MAMLAIFKVVPPPIGALLILIFIVCCGATEPPLPSAPLPVPATADTNTNAAPSATPTAVPPTPTSAPPTPESGEGITLTVSVAPMASGLPKYNRSDWKHWSDADGDCQDARQEALIAESQSAVVYENSDKCRVESGNWFGVYTGKSFTDPGDLDVDHMVPLANAHRSGGWAWQKARKEGYANDLSYANHLIAVQAAANRQKGSDGPEGWRPSRREYWCQYATDWATIKQDWGLTANPSEADALREMLQTCDEPTSLVIVPVEGASLPSPIPSALSDSELRYDPEGPDRDCGDFDTWDEAQAFYVAAGGPATDKHNLDGNNDGIACNSLRGN